MTSPFPAESRSVVLDGRSVSYRVRVSPRARRPGLLYGDAGLEVILPRRAARLDPESVLVRYRRWVLRQIDRRRERSEESRGWPDGQILLRGEPRLVFARGEDLRRWLYAEAERDLRGRLAARSAEMAQPFGRVRIADQKSLWGSCAPSRGTLSFNFRLVLAPPAVLDYIVVHELSHFAFRGHGPRFWERVRRYCPDHAVHRRWLREHGWKLRLPSVL